jgi:hypothetical protein
MRDDQIIQVVIMSIFVMLLIIIGCYSLRIAHLERKKEEQYMVDIRTLPVSRIVEYPINGASVMNPLYTNNCSIV